MSVPVGFVLLLAGLLAALAAAHFKDLRYFDRPSLARTPWFDPALAVAAWSLGIGGLAILLAVSRPAFFSCALVLGLAESYRRFIRSARFQERLLRRDFEALRRSRPGLSEPEILFELASRKHPRWGGELIEQMVRDYPTVEAFARILTKMERGFRGFR